MTSAHFSLFSLHAPSTTTRIPLLIVSSKTGHRKNYLRPKILKTLTKPSPFVHTLLLPPPQPILSPQQHNLRAEVPADDTYVEDITGAVDKSEELQVSEATAEHNGVFRDLSAAASFKYGGMYLVGAFMLHTVYSFWILRYLDSDLKDGVLEESERENRNGKTIPATNVGKILYTEDQLRMEKKIEEIKLMAREARRIESEKKGEEEEEEKEVDDDERAASSSSRKQLIEKEIGDRLLRLQNRINSKKDSSAAVARDFDKKVNLGNENLTFKKKFKFKSPSSKTTKAPKGFPGTQDSRESSAKNKDLADTGTSETQEHGTDSTDPAGILYQDKQVNQQDATHKHTRGIGTSKTQEQDVPLDERGKLVDDDESGEVLNHVEEKMETANKKTKLGFKTKSMKNGGVQETSVGMPLPEVIQSRDSSTQNSQGFVEENRDSPIFEKKDNVNGINGSSRLGLAKNNSAANRVKVKQVNTNPDMWWLNLRYVLVILMQRGSNEEGSKGLYSLNFTSREQEQSDDSHTVAFEDHADANNFCFLLESFFEDLGDFRANVVPMSTQELNEDIMSHAKKVVVVKKRQLQLYAGQPLTDVERALCSIIEQDQNAP